MLIDDWTPATGSEDRSGVQITHAHRSSGAQSHSDPRHPLVSVEPVSAGHCGVLVVDHDRDEATGNYRAGLVPIDTHAHHRGRLAPGGRMVVGMAADGAVLSLFHAHALVAGMADCLACWLPKFGGPRCLER